MKIQQFEDQGLAHFSYAVLSECQHQVVLIDPARNPQQYFDYAAQHEASIVAVIETHPHADFVSSHLEIHEKTGATLYAHSLVGATYPHTAFDEGAVLEIGKIKLKSLHTPGHSPDSISIVLEHGGKDKAVFTGDTLFIGDVGRPDLRENVGSLTARREELARQMYHSTRRKLMPLADDVMVYPAHGAGTLCGKGLRAATSSTIAHEKRTNPALQEMTEDQFVSFLTTDQPFIPKYFGYDVELNRRGAPGYQQSLQAVKRLERDFTPEAGALLIDARPQEDFKKGHLPGAFSLQNGAKFETWLGTLLDPSEMFYLAAQDDESLDQLIDKASRIGYESKIKGAFVLTSPGPIPSASFDLEDFRKNPERYTLVDIRNTPEVKEKQYFAHALHIPLPDLRERAQEIPTNKPVVIHCAGGYRSAAGSSIVEAELPQAQVFDLGEAIQQFSPL